VAGPVTSRRPRLEGASPRPGLAFVLSVASGAATAGVAGYYLGPAWAGFRNCGHSGPGAGCAPHPFWGLSPELYLLACLLGIVVGVAVAVVGLLAYRGTLARRPASYSVFALSAIGVLAYAGFGAGAAVGILAGILLYASGARRTGSPAEWSGSLPPGVPPAPRTVGRAIAARPSLTEWDGIVAAARPTPAGGGRSKISLPSADRLADALKKSRTAGPASGDDPSSSPVVFLPPPPLGLRGSSRSAVASAASNGPLTGQPVPASTAAASSVRPGTTHSDAPPTKRWQAEASELTPWGSGTSAAPPLPTPGTDAPPQPSTARGAPSTPTKGFERASGTNPPTSATRPAGRGPLREFRPAPLGGSASSRPPPPEPEANRSSPSAPPPPARAPTAPSAPTDRAPSRGTDPSAHAKLPEPSERPPPPSGPLERSRSRAWRCPNCRLVNAPWSPRCTRCKTAAPPHAPA
jgi:hypothetical protein